MHSTLAMTAAHDRYLDETKPNRRSLRESYHWFQSTIQFNEWLNREIRDEHKDPLFTTAGSLVTLAFSSPIARNIDEAWPLAPSDSSDLEWLRLWSGKMALWHLADPLRPTSVFRTMFSSMAKHITLPDKGTEGVSAELVQLCKLDESSTNGTNPFHAMAHAISRLLQTPEGEASNQEAMMVSAHMNSDFVIRLERRDPIALLLLCLWYTRAQKAKWWIAMRASYEVPAICSYLRLYHGENAVIQTLLSNHGAQ